MVSCLGAVMSRAKRLLDKIIEVKIPKDILKNLKTRDAFILTKKFKVESDLGDHQVVSTEGEFARRFFVMEKKKPNKVIPIDGRAWIKNKSIQSLGKNLE